VKSDTSRAMQEKYRGMLMAMAPGERLAACCAMFDTAKTLALAGLADEPDPQGLSLKARLFLRLYGRDFPPEERRRIVAVLQGR